MITTLLILGISFWSFRAITFMARRIASAWAQWRQFTAQRRDLQSLDEHALRDMGLSHRAAAESRQEPRVEGS